ncbi:MAG: hypothetical protein RQ714_09000 [Nitrosomonas sp.]|nr:hypothetical protein [Nitrosomonas sp.]
MLIDDLQAVIVDVLLVDQVDVPGAAVVVTRNIHRIEDILWQQDIKRARQANARNSKCRRTA